MSALTRRTFVVLLGSSSASGVGAASDAIDGGPGDATDEDGGHGYGEGGYGEGPYGGVSDGTVPKTIEVGEAIEVTDVSVDATEVSSGDSVDVSGTIHNTSDREVIRTVVLVFEGEPVGREEVFREEHAIDPGERRTVESVVDVPESDADGTYEIGFSHVEHDDEEVRVIVEGQLLDAGLEDEPSADDLDDDLVDDTPGMGAPAAIAALAGAAYLFDRSAGDGDDR